MPRPRFSDITKAVAVQVVMLSGTVSGISVDTELLHKKDEKHDFCTPNDIKMVTMKKLHFLKSPQ